MGEKSYLKFDNDHIGSVIDEEKTKTIRMGEPYVEEGEYIDIQTANGTTFTDATVTDVEEILARDIVDRDFEGHRNYVNFSAFAVQMYEYYGEILDGDEEFHIISFQVNNE